MLSVFFSLLTCFPTIMEYCTDIYPCNKLGLHHARPAIEPGVRILID